MAFIYPDIDWYTGISEQKHVQPRCPYANVHRCYRYYASLYLLGEANITTKMKSEKIKELERQYNDHIKTDFNSHEEIRDSVKDINEKIK